MNTTRRCRRTWFFKALGGALRHQLARVLLGNCLMAAGLFCLSDAHAQSPASAEPLLRVEVGAHAAPIRALSVDAAGQFAVTAA